MLLKRRREDELKTLLDKRLKCTRMAGLRTTGVRRGSPSPGRIFETN